MNPGERLPSVSELERTFGVATSTIEAALGILREDGVVVSRPRSGNYIAEPRARDRNGTARPKTTTSALAVLGLYSNVFFRHVADRVAAATEERGLAVVCRYDNHRMTLDDALSLEALDPVGFFVLGWELEWAAKEITRRGHRVVLIGEPPVGAAASVPNVYADSEHGGYLAARHLLEKGHRRLLFFHCFETDEELYRKRRWQGHLRALREAGIETAAPVLGQPVPGQCDRAALKAIFSNPDAPTAVVAWNDADGANILRALNEIGLSVPGDVSVIGYENLPVGRQTDPLLDTVDQELDLQVQQAFVLLSGPQQEGIVPPALATPFVVNRASSAPLSP
jgi:LacI family transcriptional regulator